MRWNVANAGHTGRGEQEPAGEEVVSTSGAFSFLGFLPWTTTYPLISIVLNTYRLLNLGTSGAFSFLGMDNHLSARSLQFG